MDITTDLATALINSFRAAWEAAQVRTAANWGWPDDPNACAHLAHAHHMANHNPSMWDMGGSPALYDAVRAELVAQDRFCDAVERKRLRDQGRRIEREARNAGQLTLLA